MTVAVKFTLKGQLTMTKSKYTNIRYKWLEEKGYNVMADEYQKDFVDALWMPTDTVRQVFCNAAAGTGKTSLSVLCGVYGVEKGVYRQLIYLRNAIPVRDQGFLPGSVSEKEAVYFDPLFQALDHIQPDYYQKLENNDTKDSDLIVPRTTSYLRGLNFENAFVIIDEAQSMELHELQTIYTRCADNCKIVTIGSTLQSDNKKLRKIQGLTPFEIYAKHYEGHHSINIELHNNYRGKFSLWADKINETIKELKGETT